MKREIFIIFLYLFVFIYSNSVIKESEQIELEDYKFQLINLINEKEDNNSDINSDINSDTNEDDKTDANESDDDDDKTLIICLIIGAGIVLIIIVVIIIYFLRSKFAYDKLNEKVNQISFVDDSNNNRESKTEDLN